MVPSRFHIFSSLPSSQSLTRKSSFSISNPYLRVHTIKTPPIILSSPLSSPSFFPRYPCIPHNLTFLLFPILFTSPPLPSSSSHRPIISSLPPSLTSSPPSPPLLSSPVPISPHPLFRPLYDISFPSPSPSPSSTLLPSYHPLSPSLPNYPYMPHNPLPYKPLLTRKASPLSPKPSFPTKTLPYSTQPPAHSKSINLTIQHTHHPSHPSHPPANLSTSSPYPE